MRWIVFPAAVLVVLFLTSCAQRVIEPPCGLPITLPPWSELVLHGWISDRITDGVFAKNFPIVGESGERLLEIQGYPRDYLDGMAECLMESMK